MRSSSSYTLFCTDVSWEKDMAKKLKDIRSSFIEKEVVLYGKRQLRIIKSSIITFISRLMYKPKTSWRSGCKTDVLLYIKVSELFVNYSLAKFLHISSSYTIVPGPAASKWPWNLLETLTRMPNPNHVNQKP